MSKIKSFLMENRVLIIALLVSIAVSTCVLTQCGCGPTASTEDAGMDIGEVVAEDTYSIEDVMVTPEDAETACEGLDAGVMCSGDLTDVGPGL